MEEKDEKKVVKQELDKQELEEKDLEQATGGGRRHDDPGPCFPLFWEQGCGPNN